MPARRSLRWMLCALAAACGGEEPRPAEQAPPVEEAPATFATAGVCRECHADQYAAWSGSHHDLAMQTATEATVLGDFEDAVFTQGDTTTRFSRREDDFVARVAEADGEPVEHTIRYTFGVTPLQQYLVELPGGRLQALTVAWDSRPEAEGGGRWFSLHPDGAPEPGDVLHWTGPAQRWNSQCAHCHSTDLRKRFDIETGAYQTTWSDLDVACEACHGPGSRHVAWARAGADAEGAAGLVVDLAEDPQARWVMDEGADIARREPPREAHAELESCAGCHSRRHLLDEDFASGRYLDRHLPALLEAGLYFADGQILDEVYVYGSFVQSRMYRAGVTCGNCHEPHSLELRASGDALCAQCHAPARFAATSHHHHPQDSAGARCVECHMPARTYMVIDQRRDHGFRVPRPDLSLELGSPNACNGCHGDRSAEWAAGRVAAWSGSDGEPRPHFGQALGRGRVGSANAQASLISLAQSAGEPAIARATAVELLGRYPEGDTARALTRASRDPDALVRGAAARAAEVLAPPERAALIGELLLDPARSVRTEAARVLASAPDDALTEEQRVARERALADYRSTQELHADEPSSHVNLGLLELGLGRPAEAERAYRRALKVGDYFVPAYVNLADLYRELGRDEEGEPLLRQALALVPDSADVHHALGLLLIRLQRGEEALGELRAAAELAPEQARFAYVYAVALNSSGQTELALATLRGAHEQHPNDRALLQALVAINRDLGRLDRAGDYAQQLGALTP